MNDVNFLIFMFSCLFLVLAAISTFTTMCIVEGKNKLYIQDVYIPALNISNSASLNTSIFIDLKFVKSVTPLFTRLLFVDSNMTLFYGSNRSFPVATQTVGGFAQGRKRRVLKKEAVEARALPWEDALRTVSGGEAVALVVELAVKFQYQGCSRYEGPDKCKWSGGKAAADVWVDATGQKVSRNPIRFH